jgi:hypothetical protein
MLEAKAHRQLCVVSLLWTVHRLQEKMVEFEVLEETRFRTLLRIHELQFVTGPE